MDTGEIIALIVGAAGILSFGGTILMFFFGRRERNAVLAAVHTANIQAIRENCDRHQQWQADLAKAVTDVSKGLTHLQGIVETHINPQTVEA